MSALTGAFSLALVGSLVFLAGVVFWLECVEVEGLSERVLIPIIKVYVSEGLTSPIPDEQIAKFVSNL